MSTSFISQHKHITFVLCSSTASAKSVSAGKLPSSPWLTAALQTPTICWEAQGFDNEHHPLFSSKWSPDLLRFPDHVPSARSVSHFLRGSGAERMEQGAQLWPQHALRTTPAAWGATCVLPSSRPMVCVVAHHLDIVRWGWHLHHSAPAAGPQRPGSLGPVRVTSFGIGSLQMRSG